MTIFTPLPPLTDAEIREWAADLAHTESSHARTELRRDVDRVRAELGLPSRTRESWANLCAAMGRLSADLNRSLRRLSTRPVPPAIYLTTTPVDPDNQAYHRLSALHRSEEPRDLDRDRFLWGADHPVPRAERERGRAARPERDPGVSTFTAKFHADCAVCDTDLKGSEAVYTSSGDIIHVRCPDTLVLAREVCPSCFLELPVTGVCGDCDGA